MAAYEDMIRHTATEHAPWVVVPADHKWFTRLVVADEVGAALADLELSFPKADRARRKELAERFGHHTQARDFLTLQPAGESLVSVPRTAPSSAPLLDGLAAHGT